MLHKASLTNKNYLAMTTLVSIGLLSGCEYCMPVLMTLLVIPVMRSMARSLPAAGHAQRECP